MLIKTTFSCLLYIFAPLRAVYAHAFPNCSKNVLITTCTEYTLGRGRNKFENLCPIPLKKDSIKYVQTNIHVDLNVKQA